MKIQSTALEVKPIEFDGQKVRVRTNIERITRTDDKDNTQELWQYDEEQITLKELEFRKTMGTLPKVK